MTVTPKSTRHDDAILAGWGRYPIVRGEEVNPSGLAEIPTLLAQGFHPRGHGRSYGDAGLPAPGHVSINSYRLDRLLSLNADSGVLDAEAGITLQAILKEAIPRGFFLPVSPGTQFVSLGGAIASNVHGKNHHLVGSLEHFILEMEVATPTGIFVCSPHIEVELFRATVGGYGLTGFITRAKIQMKPIASGQLECLRVRANGLDALFSLFAKHDSGYEYSVAWLDTLSKGKSLGRGILMLGNHSGSGVSAKLSQIQKTTYRVPFSMPSMLLNRPFLTIFNSTFFCISRNGFSQEGLEGFFYPLDRIRDWNRMYGKDGFFQYQCVIPDPKAEEGVAKILEFLSANGLGAFLSVLKRCGNDTPMLPFCRKGYTLALDIPFRGQVTLQLLDKLDAITMRYEGRVYLTKDARLSAETFRVMYPEHKSWMETVRRYNPEAKGNSRLAERLELWKI